MMLYLLVVLCCSYVLWRLWSKKRNHLEPPELSGRLPIVGHGHKFLGDCVKKYNTIVAMSKECLEKGGVVTGNLGPRKCYGITDPDDSLTLMNACLEKSILFTLAKPLLGNGLLIADVKRWHTSRKLLNPAFNQKVLDGYVGIFNSQAEDLVKKFAGETGKPFDHDKLLRMNNLETICSTSLAVNVNEYEDIFKNYVPLLSEVCKEASSRAMKFWLHNDIIYNMTRRKKIFDENMNGLTSLSKKIIQNRKTAREIRSTTKTKSEKPQKFIDLILDVAEETGCFTDEEIREETDNIIAGGHDTTASTLTFALTLLGSHADVQEKLYEEISHVCGNSENVDKDDLSQLVYTEAVLKETLRLYPIAVVITRYTDKEVKLKNCTIKANTDCFILVHGLHHHSVWGPDADQFRPERWLVKETLPDPKYYGAFGLGRRSCIGKVYAMMWMKILLAHVIRRYRVSSDVSKMVVSLHIIIRPESGYFITLEHRGSHAL